MDTGNKALIRDMNIRFILKMIIETGPISRADIAKLSGLTKATVSAIVKLLLDQQLVVETGSAATQKGRKPILLKFCPESGYIIVFDIGRLETTVLASDLCGHTIYLQTYPTPADKEALLPWLIQTIARLKDTLPPSIYGVVGICIGIHGTVHDSTIVFAPYYPYAGLQLKTPLEDYFHIPVFVENEANLSVIGEHGFCFDCDNLAVLSIHSGIGLGVILHGRLYTGPDGYAGEFGHSVIELGGCPCPCGNRGCLEQYASEQALLKEYARLKGLTRIPSFEMFKKAADQKEPGAVHILEIFTTYIAAGLNNIVQMLNPELIIISSRFTDTYPELIENIRAQLPRRIRPLCRMRTSLLSSRAVLLGGVCLVLKNFLRLDRVRLEKFLNT
ncbi:MAG TPA: ROK family transcriptional regulator [Candidatus Scybalocola faecipullorum]|nr:ROK family transcriptional regulator [Candidatus Scybalocola faecipullorum]